MRACDLIVLKILSVVRKSKFISIYKTCITLYDNLL